MAKKNFTKAFLDKDLAIKGQTVTPPPPKEEKPKPVKPKGGKK